MQCRRAAHEVSALYGVFIQPYLAPRCSVSARTATTPSPTPRSHLGLRRPCRAFATSRSPLPSSNSAAPQAEGPKFDDRITETMIVLVDPETNKLGEAQTRKDIMSRLDRSTHRLMQVSETVQSDAFGEANYAICKIVEKKALFDAEKKRKAQQKEALRERKLITNVKTLELNWAIDKNDLGHRLEKAVEFLNEGRRLDVVMAPKRRGRKASIEECETVLEKVQAAMETVSGARELKSEGRIGGTMTITFQGRPL